MILKFSDDLIAELIKIEKKDNKLSKRIEKQLALFQQNPTYPSLRLHKVTSKFGQAWSISINMSVRMLYVLQGDSAYFFDIGKHEEVYR